MGYKFWACYTEATSDRGDFATIVAFALQIPRLWSGGFAKGLAERIVNRMEEMK